MTQFNFFNQMKEWCNIQAKHPGYSPGVSPCEFTLPQTENKVLAGCIYSSKTALEVLLSLLKTITGADNSVHLRFLDCKNVYK